MSVFLIKVRYAVLMFLFIDCILVAIVTFRVSSLPSELQAQRGERAVVTDRP